MEMKRSHRYLSAILARSSSSINLSVVLVIMTFAPQLRSCCVKLFAIARFMIFSEFGEYPNSPAPGSFPPWPASTIIVLPTSWKLFVVFGLYVLLGLYVDFGV